ncbi:MAG: tetratricopeptide repeat protein [Fidelibacterota bacterium]
MLPRGKVLFLILSLGMVSCAYFNTFYNAQQYFKDAERELLGAKEGSKLSKRTLDALDKTVQKCTRVIESYPQSRWWDDALLLRGKALFYRGDYALAEASFERLMGESSGSPLVPEAELWVLRCRWKLGTPDVALQGLREILVEKGSGHGPRLKPRDRALGNEWAAEIYLQWNQIDSAVHYYVQSSRYLRSSTERSKVFLKIADLAHSHSRYSQAVEYYRKVVRLSERPADLERAHLQIIRIARMQRRWEEATRQIQALLSEGKLSGIRPELYLELARLYEVQNRTGEAMNRYTRITEEFPRTESSAEAYFRLGMLTLKTSGDYEDSKNYFSKVEKENRFSMFIPSARIKVKEIEALLTILDALEKTGESGFPEEPSGAPGDTAGIPDSYPDQLYAYGELMAFHFDQPDSGIRAFESLTGRFPKAVKRPQALYALAHLYRERGQEKKAEELAKQLVAEYPLTEYAQQASRMIGMVIQDEVQAKLREAEKVVSTDPLGAVALYREIVEKTPHSRYAPVAIMAIARTYDVRLNDLENSLTWYGRLIQEFPDSEQAVAVKGRYQELLELSRTPFPLGQGGDPEGALPPGSVGDWQ